MNFFTFIQLIYIYIYRFLQLNCSQLHLNMQPIDSQPELVQNMIFSAVTAAILYCKCTCEGQILTFPWYSLPSSVLTPPFSICTFINDSVSGEKFSDFISCSRPSSAENSIALYGVFSTTLIWDDILSSGKT